MVVTVIKELGRLKRHQRIRRKIEGTKERPRLSVHRSLKNIFVQLIDDIEGKTLYSISTLDKRFKEKFKGGGNVKAAEILGEMFAREAQGKGIRQVVFDRGGYLYHGRLKALAEAARKAGLEF
ncbi:MAG: 50S ribosomal protein L18 [Candidatus Omnitrophota bacterium]